MIVLTDQERHVMRHALGLNSSKVAYRNRFIASEEQAIVWRDLVQRGLAHEHTDMGGAPLFCVRLAGVNAVLWHDERLDDEETDHVQRLEERLSTPRAIEDAA